MRRLLKILGRLVLGLVVLAALAIGVILLFFPRSEPASREAIARTPERLARGSYLVNHVAFCMNCHSERNWAVYSGPVIPGTRGGGALVADPMLPAHSANITPFGIGDWTDGEVVRAITAGVKKDGTALHPLMPYDTYAKLSQEDIRSIVAYLRTLPAVQHAVPKQRAGSLKELLLVNVIGRTLPRPWRPKPAPDREDRVEYGAYLVKLAECRSCHGANLSGGHSFRLPGNVGGAWVVSSNLTPDLETGIGRWTPEIFVGVFKAYTSQDSPRLQVVTDASKNTVMPWLQYAGMTEEDLRAIFEYLRSLEPVKKKVVTSPQDGSSQVPR